MSEHIGEMAALTAAVCWTFTSLAFAAAGRRIGSLNVNLIRLAMAMVFLALYGWVVRGLPWPSDAPSRTWGWLLLSGLAGFFIGDLCLFETYVLVGARLGSLMMALVPPMTALIGWTMLGERLALREWIGMAVTLAGIGLVLAEKHGESDAPHDVKRVRTGLFLGLGAAAGQAVGLVLSKRGMKCYDAFGATQIRVLAGLSGFIVLFAAKHRWRSLSTALRNRSGLGYTSIGAMLGPFIGVSLSLVAVQHIATGVAATIMALTPVFVIPATVWLHGERVGWRTWLGTMIAVGGVALICLR